ncbi:MAG: hypothetical protein HY962_00620 [Ignavibacteriae bacterium]|nr:hypothetical protein [Ignavibacteriota bacterium]
MATANKNMSGYLTFFAIVAIVFGGFLTFQASIAGLLIERFFTGYELYESVMPGKWIIMNRLVMDDEGMRIRMKREDVFTKITSGEFNPKDQVLNDLQGRAELKEKARDAGDTLYFIDPLLAFSPLYMFIALIMAFLMTLYLPMAESLSLIRQSLERVYEQMEFSLKKQCESHQLAFETLLGIDSRARMDMIRESTLPEVTVKEMDDFVELRNWREGSKGNPLVPLKFYFRYHVTAVYGNMIQGLVAGGAAILIFVIGLRGLKLIPPEEPSLILMALSLEFILLIVLMLTFAGSAQEERLDRVVKELEAEQRDAIKQQTDALQRIFDSMTHEGLRRTDGMSMADYEERKVLDEVLTLLRKHAKPEKGTNGG